MARSDYWIKVFDSLPGHWKVRHLQGVMKWNRFETVGFLVMFWLQVASDAPDGVLDKLVSINDILKAVGLNNKSKKEKDQWGKVIQGMLAVRFLEKEEPEDGGAAAYWLHDWEDGGGKLQKTRAGDTLRQQNRRSRQGDEAPGSRHADVTRESKSKEKDLPPYPPQAGGGFADFQNRVSEMWASACAEIPVDAVRDNSTTRGLAAIAKELQAGAVSVDAVRAAMGNFLRLKHGGPDASKMATWGVPALAKSLATYIPKKTAAAASSPRRLVEMRCRTCGYTAMARLRENEETMPCASHAPPGAPCAGMMEVV